MPSAEERFRAKVKHRGGHDLWTGSRDHRGVGMVRIDGKLRTVQRAAWEFAYGPLEPGARVNTCAVDRACVTVSHLSLSPGAGTPSAIVRRRRRGSGSAREVRPGVWEIAFTIGPSIDGRARRRFLTIEGSRGDVEAELDRIRQLLVRDDLGDLRIRELVGRYLEHLHGGAAEGRDEDLLDDVLEPALGGEIASLATTGEIHRALENVAKQGAALADVRGPRSDCCVAATNGPSLEDSTTTIRLRTSTRGGSADDTRPMIDCSLEWTAFLNEHDAHRDQLVTTPGQPFARQLAAGALDRLLMCSDAIWELQERRSRGLAGIVMRHAFECWVIGLYLCFDDDAVRHLVDADYRSIQTIVRDWPDGNWADELTGHPGTGPRSLSVQDVARRVSEIVRERDITPLDPLVQYHALYRVESRLAAHAGLATLLAHLDINDERVAIADHRPTGYADDVAYLWTLTYAAHLARHVYEAYDISSATMNNILYACIDLFPPPLE